MFLKITTRPDNPRYVQWTIPSILYQTRQKNPLVYKGLIITRVTGYNFQYNIVFGPRREKTCLRGFTNNKGADQPAHTRSLITAFVVHLMESIMLSPFYKQNFNVLACLCS